MPELALNGFGSLRDSSSNFDPQKNFVFFVFFVEKNRTLISDLTQSNFKVLLIEEYAFVLLILNHRLNKANSFFIEAPFQFIKQFCITRIASIWIGTFTTS